MTLFKLVHSTNQYEIQLHRKQKKKWDEQKVRLKVTYTSARYACVI